MKELRFKNKHTFKTDFSGFDLAIQESSEEERHRRKVSYRKSVVTLRKKNGKSHFIQAEDEDIKKLMQSGYVERKPQQRIKHDTQTLWVISINELYQQEQDNIKLLEKPSPGQDREMKKYLSDLRGEVLKAACRCSQATPEFFRWLYDQIPNNRYET